MKVILFGSILLTPLPAMGQKVLMQWDFENITNKTCIETETTIADTIEGNFEQAPGVAGKGLRLDGFTTRVVRSGADLKNPGGDSTLEAWVSLGEYPWNWCPVITTESSGVNGYRLTSGPMGQVSLEAAVGEQWICCTSAKETIPLRKWMHLAGIAADSLMRPIAPDPVTFGFRWNNQLVTRTKSKAGSLVTLPEYYHLVKDDTNKNGKWVAVVAREVPAETGLAKVSFRRPEEKPLPPLVTPEDAVSCWKKAGPAAGPFKASPGDGSTMTYYWYRCADQPALLNADLTDAERHTAGNADKVMVANDRTQIR